jgi:hypothetical protein
LRETSSRSGGGESHGIEEWALERGCHQRGQWWMVKFEARSSKGTFFCVRYGVLRRPKMIRCIPMYLRTVAVPCPYLLIPTEPSYRYHRVTFLRTKVCLCTYSTWVESADQRLVLYCTVPAKATAPLGRLPLPRQITVNKGKAFLRLNVAHDDSNSAFSPFIYFLLACLLCLIAFHQLHESLWC